MSEVRLSFGEDAYMRSVLKEAGRITAGTLVSPSSTESHVLIATSTGIASTPRRRASWINCDGV